MKNPEDPIRVFPYLYSENEPRGNAFLNLIPVNDATGSQTERISTGIIKNIISVFASENRYAASTPNTNVLCRNF